MKTTKAALTACAIAAFSGLSTHAYACGESLFRVGKGAAYRAQTAPLPAYVLMVTPTDAARDLAKRLRLAGHHVHTVESADQLAQELHKERFHVVLAAFSDRETVEAQRSGAEAAYLPITLDRSEELLAAQLYQRVLSADDSFKVFLRTIHRTVKAGGA
jgi:D-arabinose 1-dehydrogenase-like Zn-dependent alcohol dehydrogenase